MAGSRKGVPNKLTAAIKDKLEHAFNTVNGPANAGLIALAADHPAIFYGLVSKLIPVQASVALHLGGGIDLGAAMLQAQQRVERLNALKDITPAHVSPNTIDVLPVKVIEDNMVVESEKVPRVSRKKRQVERVKKK